MKIGGRYVSFPFSCFIFSFFYSFVFSLHSWWWESLFLIARGTQSVPLWDILLWIIIDKGSNEYSSGNKWFLNSISIDRRILNSKILIRALSCENLLNDVNWSDRALFLCGKFPRLLWSLALGSGLVLKCSYVPLHIFSLFRINRTCNSPPVNREVKGSSDDLYILHHVWERPPANNLL
jgi:hypothetical protein